MRLFAWKSALSATLALLSLTSACGSRKKPIVIGSKNDTEGTLLGEIIAQHLEHRLETKVGRQLSLGDTNIAYQALITGQVGLYPEYTGTIETMLIKETPSADPTILLQRSRSEIFRIAQAELLDPLGFDSRATMVVHSGDAPSQPTLTAAGEGTLKWNIGVGFDFQSRPDGLAALTPYRLPQGSPIRGMDARQLWTSMEKGELNMISSTATDGHLAANIYAALADDKNVFPPQQACVLVREDKIMEEPRLKPALQELAGKFTVQSMRKWNAQVDLEKKPVAQVAAAALAEAGIK